MFALTPHSGRKWNKNCSHVRKEKKKKDESLMQRSKQMQESNVKQWFGLFFMFHKLKKRQKTAEKAERDGDKKINDGNEQSNRAKWKTCRVKKESELEAARRRSKESLMQKPRGYPAIPECFALTYFGISVSVFVSAAL